MTNNLLSLSSLTHYNIVTEKQLSFSNQQISDEVVIVGTEEKDKNVLRV